MIVVSFDAIFATRNVNVAFRSSLALVIEETDISSLR